MTHAEKKPCSRNVALAKFIIFSGLGIFMFFVNIEINGKNVIPIQHVINFVKATCGPVIPYYALAMVAFGAIYPIVTKAYKRSTFDLVFTIAKAFGLVIAFMAITGIGPASLDGSGYDPVSIHQLSGSHYLEHPPYRSGLCYDVEFRPG